MYVFYNEIAIPGYFDSPLNREAPQFVINLFNQIYQFLCRRAISAVYEQAHLCWCYTFY